MGVEKEIEKSIVNYLNRLGARTKKTHSGKVQIKKPGYVCWMQLCEEGTVDISCFYKGNFYGIEVKKNQKEVDNWKKIEQRFNGTGKPLPEPYINNKGKRAQSNETEINQIKEKQKIIANGGIHILTCDLQDIINIIN